MPASARIDSSRRRLRRLVAAVVATGVVVGGGGSAAVVPTAGAEEATAPQEPFLCTTEWNDLGQPIVDNDEGRGTPVYPEVDGEIDRSADPIGWSADCQAEATVEYRYRDVEGEIVEFRRDTTELPDDIAMIPVEDLVGTDEMDLGDVDEIPYLLRYQRVTLPETRFILSTAMLVPFEQALGGEEGWNHDHWNGRLVFSFGGGVGIGHSQGDIHGRDSQLDNALRLGHAVVYSSGTRTSTHYDLLLGGRTATEAKAHFADEHGDPLYTVGIGGSGGGIQQYVYAQNHPDLLDGLIPQYSYPDMTTQTIAVGDCELLEHHMDVTDADNPRWRNWDDRRIIQGLNTLEGYESDWQERMGTTGSSECIEGWRGATPLALNPTFGLAVDMEKAVEPYVGELLALSGADEPLVPADFPDLGRLLRTSPDPDDRVEWTHWADVVDAYGENPDTGFARMPWDNVGVQYGLRSVARGQIDPEEFLHLNRTIGSWKDQTEAVPESCGMIEALAGDEVAMLGTLIGLCEGDETDAWSSRMMRLADGDEPAPRTEGDVEAITNAFTSGLEFDGELGRDVPILDVRHYLEHELDMHNVHQSFTVRERIRRARGDVDNHVVWFLDARPERDDDATDRLLDEAFRTMDEWIPPTLDGTAAADAKPTAAVDSCWDTDGTPIASGDDVWSGAVELSTSGEGDWSDAAPDEVDGVPVGDCAAHFPIHSNSRIVAGAPITNDVYKCHLKSVEQSIEDGDYGDWEPTDDERAELETIFADGVCDWSLRTVGHPSLTGDDGGGDDDPTDSTDDGATTADDGDESDDSGISPLTIALIAIPVGLIAGFILARGRRTDRSGA